MSVDLRAYDDFLQGKGLTPIDKSAGAPPSIGGRGATDPEETKFQEWYKSWAKIAEIDPNPDNPLHKYDYRAAFKAGVEPEFDPKDTKYHWPSEFKAPDHPNRFVGGVDTITGQSTYQSKPGMEEFDSFLQAKGLKPIVVPQVEPERLGEFDSWLRGKGYKPMNELPERLPPGAAPEMLPSRQPTMRAVTPQEKAAFLGPEKPAMREFAPKDYVSYEQRTSLTRNLKDLAKVAINDPTGFMDLMKMEAGQGVVTGLTLGNVNGINVLSKLTGRDIRGELNQAWQKKAGYVPEKALQIVQQGGAFLGGAIPVAAIAITSGAAAAAATSIPILQSAIRIAVGSTLFGLAQKPEDDTLWNRFAQIPGAAKFWAIADLGMMTGSQLLQVYRWNKAFLGEEAVRFTPEQMYKLAMKQRNGMTAGMKRGDPNYKLNFTPEELDVMDTLSKGTNDGWKNAVREGYVKEPVLPRKPEGGDFFRPMTQTKVPADLKAQWAAKGYEKEAIRHPVGEAPWTGAGPPPGAIPTPPGPTPPPPTQPGASPVPAGKQLAPPKVKVTPTPDGGWEYEVVPPAREPAAPPIEWPEEGVKYDTTKGRGIPPEPRPGAGPGERAIPRAIGPGQPLDARFGTHLEGSLGTVRNASGYKQSPIYHKSVENAALYIQAEFNRLPEPAKNWFLDQLDSGKVKLKVWTYLTDLPTAEGPFPKYVIDYADAFTWDKKDIYVNPLKLQEFYGGKIPEGILSHEILHTAFAEIGSKNPEQVEFYKKQIATLSLPYIEHLEKSYTKQLPLDHPDYFADMIYSSMLDISRNVPDPTTQQWFLHDMIVKAMSVRMADPLGPAKWSFFKRWRELRGLQPGPVSARDRQAIMLSYIHTIYDRLGIAGELGDFGFHELFAYNAMVDPAMVENLFRPLRPGAPKAALPAGKGVKPAPPSEPAPPPTAKGAPKEIPPAPEREPIPPAKPIPEAQPEPVQPPGAVFDSKFSMGGKIVTVKAIGWKKIIPNSKPGRLTQIYDAWIRLRPDVIPYVSYQKIAKETGLTIEDVAAELKALWEKDKTAYVPTVDRLGNNYAFKFRADYKPSAEIFKGPTPPPIGGKPTGPWKIYTKIHGTRDADIMGSLEAEPGVTVKTIKVDRTGHRTLEISGPEKKNVLAVGKRLQRTYGKRIRPVRPDPTDETANAKANLFGRIRSNFMILDKQPKPPAKIKPRVSVWQDDLYGFIKSVGGIRPGGAFGMAEFRDLNLPPGLVRKGGSSAEDIYTQAKAEGLIHESKFGDARDLYTELENRKLARGRPPVETEEPLPDEYQALRRIEDSKRPIDGETYKEWEARVKKHQRALPFGEEEAKPITEAEISRLQAKTKELAKISKETLDKMTPPLGVGMTYEAEPGVIEKAEAEARTEKVQRSEITAKGPFKPIEIEEELPKIPTKEEMREFDDAQFDLFNQPPPAGPGRLTTDWDAVRARVKAEEAEQAKIEGLSKIIKDSSERMVEISEEPPGPPLFLPDEELMNYVVRTLDGMKGQFVNLSNSDYYQDRFLDLVNAFQGKDVAKMENYARVLLSKRGLRRMAKTYDKEGKITGYIPREPEQMPAPAEREKERGEEPLERAEPVFQGTMPGPEEGLHMESIEKANQLALEKTLDDFRYIAQENDRDFEILKDTYINGLSLREIAEKLRTSYMTVSRRLDAMRASGQIAGSAAYRRYLETKIQINRMLDKRAQPLLHYYAGIPGPTSKIEAMELWENFKRLFFTGRGLPKEIEHAADQRVNEFVAHKFMATVEARELNRWIAKENNNNPRVRAYVLDVLTGEEDPNFGYLPEKIKDLLRRMRGQLDLLSQQIIANVVPKTPAERALINSIGRNLGHYLGKFYKLHEYNLKYARRKWLRRYYHPTPEAREAFKQQLLRDHPRIFGGLSNKDLEEYLDSIIRGKPFQYQFQGSRRKSIPTQHFIKRKELSQAWRDFLGEIEDPVYLYIRTTVDMASMVYNAKFLNQVYAGYEGKLWSRTLVPSWKNYTLDDNLKWGKMRGAYIHPALYEFLKYELTPMVDATSRFIEQLIINPFKLSKTVFSVPTHARNFFGNVMFSMLNRNLILNPTNWRYYLKAADVFFNRNRILGPEKGADAWNELVRRGVTETQYYGAEVPKIYERLMRLDPEEWWDYLARVPRWTLAKLGGAYNFEDALYRIAAYYKDVEHFNMTPAEGVDEVNRSMTNYRKLPAAVDWLRKWPVLGPFVSFKWNVGKILANQVVEGINQVRAGAGYGEPKYRSGRRGGPFGNVPSPEAEAGYERMKNSGMFWDGMRRLWRVMAAVSTPFLIKEAVERYYEIDQEKMAKIEKFYPDFLRQGIFVYWKDDQGRVRQIDLSNIWPTGELAELIKAMKKGDVSAALKVLNVAESPLFDLWSMFKGIDPVTLQQMDPNLLKRAGYMLQRIFLPASLPIPSSGTLRQLIKTGKFEPRAGILTTNQIKRLIDAYWGEGVSGTKLPEELRAFFTGMRSYVVDPQRILGMAARSAQKQIEEERRKLSSWGFKSSKAPKWEIAEKIEGFNQRIAKIAKKLEEINELQKYFLGGEDAGR